MTALRKFSRLAPAERRLTFEALLLPVAISGSFHLLGVARTQAWVRRWAQAGKRCSIGADAAGAGAAGADPATDIQMARRAQRRVLRATGVLGPCLVRSLTLWAILLRRGVEVSLRVGFRHRDGKFEGHAWVEYEDVPLNETESETRTFKVYEQPVCYDLWR